MPKRHISINSNVHICHVTIKLHTTMASYCLPPRKGGISISPYLQWHYSFFDTNHVHWRYYSFFDILIYDDVTFNTPLKVVLHNFDIPIQWWCYFRYLIHRRYFSLIIHHVYYSINYARQHISSYISNKHVNQPIQISIIHFMPSITKINK